MSLPWMWGAYSTTAGDAEVNYPSLWGGGWTWQPAGSGTGTQFYWQTTAAPTDRTGEPEISIAIGGVPVRHTVRSAGWQLGRSEWLSVLQPGGASFEVEGPVTGSVMDTVVIGVLSDTTDQHSAPLWCGYVDDISTTTDASGRVTTSVSCVDVVGRLGQADTPASFPSVSTTLAGYLEAVAEQAGTQLVVIDDSVLSGDSGSLFSFQDDETVLGFLNRSEQADNYNLFLRGDGKLALQRRWYQDSPDLDPAPDAVSLTGADAPTRWTVRDSPTTVFNDLPANYASTAAQAASQLAYGRRSYGAPTEDYNGWDQMLGTGILNGPRPLLAGADLPVTDLSHPALFLDPGDWAVVDGTTYQVLSVSHQVEPGRRWSVSITGDSTQPLLRQEYS